jgi:hypothetical protein
MQSAGTGSLIPPSGDGDRSGDPFDEEVGHNSLLGAQRSQDE